MNSVECSFPASEDVAVGALYVCANVLAIIMTFVGQVTDTCGAIRISSSCS